MEWLWFVTVVIGPILLFAVIVYVTFRYWNRRRDLDAYSDRKSREVREEQAREQRHLG